MEQRKAKLLLVDELPGYMQSVFHCRTGITKLEEEKEKKTAVFLTINILATDQIIEQNTYLRIGSRHSRIVTQTKETGQITMSLTTNLACCNKNVFHLTVSVWKQPDSLVGVVFVSPKDLFSSLKKPASFPIYKISQSTTKKETLGRGFTTREAPSKEEKNKEEKTMCFVTGTIKIMAMFCPEYTKTMGGKYKNIPTSPLVGLCFLEPPDILLVEKEAQLFFQIDLIQNKKTIVNVIPTRKIEHGKAIGFVWPFFEERFPKNDYLMQVSCFLNKDTFLGQGCVCLNELYTEKLIPSTFIIALHPQTAHYKETLSRCVHSSPWDYTTNNELGSWQKEVGSISLSFAYEVDFEEKEYTQTILLLNDKRLLVVKALEKNKQKNTLIVSLLLYYNSNGRVVEFLCSVYRKCSWNVFKKYLDAFFFLFCKDYLQKNIFPLLKAVVSTKRSGHVSFSETASQNIDNSFINTETLLEKHLSFLQSLLCSLSSLPQILKNLLITLKTASKSTAISKRILLGTIIANCIEDPLKHGVYLKITRKIQLEHLKETGKLLKNISNSQKNKPGNTPADILEEKASAAFDAEIRNVLSVYSKNIEKSGDRELNVKQIHNELKKNKILGRFIQ